MALPKVESAERLTLIGHLDVPGGNGMQLMTYGDRLFFGHRAPGLGTTVIDVAEPTDPRVIGTLPGFEGAFSPKVQIDRGVLFVNYEDREGGATRAGVGLFELGSRGVPKEITYLHIGGRGVHRMWASEGRLYVSAVPEGFSDRMLLIYDVTTPDKPEELGRWWIKGLNAARGERPTWPAGVAHNLHHAIVRGNRAYMGCWDAGLKILDVSDPSSPRQVGELGGWAPHEGGSTHTALPLPTKPYLVLTDEATKTWGQQPERDVRVVDISDETAPRLAAFLPRPAGAFHPGKGRLGPHNLHEPHPGAFVSDTLVFGTFYAAGVRVYDLSHPVRPREVAHLVPEAPPGEDSIQINDLYVAGDGLIYLSDRGPGGLYVVEMDPSLRARGRRWA